jgi:hypothetical protein
MPLILESSTGQSNAISVGWSRGGAGPSGVRLVGVEFRAKWSRGGVARESASSLLVGFGDLNDDIIKGLTSLLSVE